MGPPQSIAVSLPFFLPSLHVATAHLLFVQMALRQSPSDRQFLVSAQSGHVPPPQSMSVSALFLRPSMHVGAQTRLVQRLLLQSVLTLQSLPVGQSAQAPPQSVSVSEPFLVPSLHDAGAHS